MTSVEYATGLGDIALPPDMRESKRSHALFGRFLSEGPRSAAERLLDFLRSEGVAGAEFSLEGLRVVDRWLAEDAPIAVELPTTKIPLDNALAPTWRDITVDLFALVGELVGEYFHVPEWELSDASRGDGWRLLPGVIDVEAPDPPAGLLSSQTYMMLVFYGRILAGTPLRSAPSPLHKAIEALESLHRDGASTLEDLERRRSRGPLPPRWDKPAIPPLPASSREIIDRERSAGRLGSFGELIVFAPMSLSRAQSLLEDETDAPRTTKPAAALVQLITELYRTWPHVVGDPEAASPWQMDLYDRIGKNSISMPSSRQAPSGPLFEAVIDLAKKRGMPVYAIDGDEWFS